MQLDENPKWSMAVRPSSGRAPAGCVVAVLALFAGPVSCARPATGSRIDSQTPVASDAGPDSSQVTTGAGAGSTDGPLGGGVKPGFPDALSRGDQFVVSDALRADGGASEASGMDSARAPSGIVSLSIVPTTGLVVVGAEAPLRVIGLNVDGTTEDLTSVVLWSSSDQTVVSVLGGILKALRPGDTVIRAEYQGLSAAMPVSAVMSRAVRLEVSPPELTLLRGASRSFTATAAFENGQTWNVTERVTWSVSDARIAVVGKNVLTAQAVGVVTLTAELSGIRAVASVTVVEAAAGRLEVFPEDARRRVGERIEFLALVVSPSGAPIDVTSLATWRSTVPRVARVTDSRMGGVECVGSGLADIGATYGGSTTTAELNCGAMRIEQLEVVPRTLSLGPGDQHQLVAVARYPDGTTVDVSAVCTWESSHPGVATVDIAGPRAGQVTARTLGSTSMKASCMGSAAAASIVVEARRPLAIGIVPISPVVVVGAVTPLRAIVTYSDGSTENVSRLAAWTSSDQSVATFSAVGGGGRFDPLQGEAVPLAPGTTKITAKYLGLSASTTMTVVATAVVDIQVTPYRRSLPKGLAAGLTATALYSDNTTRDITREAAWNSDNVSVIVVSNAAASKGRVTALAAGTALVSARLAGNVGTASFTVLGDTVERVELSPRVVSTPVEVSTPIEATAILTSGARFDLLGAGIWTSSSESVAFVVSGQRETVLKPVAPGRATVRVDAAGVIADLPCEITAVKLSTLTVSPDRAALKLGQQQALTASALYADGSRYDVTEQALWTSGSIAVIRVSNAFGARGVATAVTAGTTQVEALFAGNKGTASITVSRE